MRVVIDTNCLIASLPPQGDYYWLYQAFEAEQFEWLNSNEILSEYLEKLTELYSEDTALLVYSIISTAVNVTFTEPFFKWQLVTADPDDNKFADLSIAGNVDYLVTNDKHFNALKTLEFPKLTIISLVEFKQILDLNK
jgi:putative PIN family toxin of toxin-antitoxin system